MRSSISDQRSAIGDRRSAIDCPQQPITPVQREDNASLDFGEGFVDRYLIGVVVGSLRRDSFNRRLADAVKSLAPSDFSFTDVRIDDLPLYNQDDDAHPVESVIRLKRDLAAANGFLFVTPEYNRSIPGVLKNAIDHGSRPRGQSAWAGKPAGVIGISPGPLGTSMAQQHLRNVLAHLDVPTLGQPEVFIQVKEGLFDESGVLVSEGTKTFLQKWVNRYVAWVKAHAG
jgi:chromate reductase